MSALRLALFCFAALLATIANAQMTYRWVDKATGRTVFSDQAPPPGATEISRQKSTSRTDDAPLPYAVRQAAEKFPVTLYTSASCVEACQDARTLLNGRGIPFTEKMLTTQAEIDELSQRLGAEASVPTLIVGQQNFRGLEAAAWNNLLDLAGYPKTAAYGSKPSGAFTK